MSRAVKHLSESIWSVLDRARLEYDLSYAEVIGVLELIKLDVAEEGRLPLDEDELDDDELDDEGDV